MPAIHCLYHKLKKEKNTTAHISTLQKAEKCVLIIYQPCACNCRHRVKKEFHDRHYIYWTEGIFKSQLSEERGIECLVSEISHWNEQYCALTEGERKLLGQVIWVPDMLVIALLCHFWSVKFSNQYYSPLINNINTLNPHFYVIAFSCVFSICSHPKTVCRHKRPKSFVVQQRP